AHRSRLPSHGMPAITAVALVLAVVVPLTLLRLILPVSLGDLAGPGMRRLSRGLIRTAMPAAGCLPLYDATGDALFRRRLDRLEAPAVVTVRLPLRIDDHVTGISVARHEGLRRIRAHARIVVPW